MASPVAVTIKSDTAAVKRMFRHQRRTAEKVISRALNKTITSVRSTASKTIGKEMGLPQKRVRQDLRIVKAYPGRLTAMIVARGKPVPLIEFGARQTKKGVTYRSEHRVRKLLAHAFIARMPGGHLGVYSRVAKKRLPIEEHFAHSIPVIMVERHIYEALDKRALERWQVTLPHELERELNRG